MTGRRQVEDAQRPAAEDTGYSSTGLIGRDDELQRLVATLSGWPGLAVVEGEAGVGKSQLVREALRPWAGGQILVGHGHPLRDPFTLGPLVEVLEGLAPMFPQLGLSPLAGALRPFLPEAGPSLPEAPEPLETRSAEQHRIFRAMAEVIERVVPAVLVVEDLHWADESTLDFLGFLGTRAPADLSIVMTYRTEEMGNVPGLRRLLGRLPPTTCRLHLEPLDHVGVRRMVESILDTLDVSDEFVHHLHRSTAGLPFAVEEVLRLLVERRDLVRRQGRWARRLLQEIHLPIAVRDSVLERVGRLSPDARGIIEAAGILGVPEDAPTLRAVSGSSPSRYRRGLVEALRSGLLREGPAGRYALRHELAIHAVADSITPPDCRRMHARAVERLRRRPEAPMGRLAHHSREAGGMRAWARFADAAADIAESLGDDAAAFRILQEVLAEPWLPRATRARLATKLGRTALHGLAHGEAVEVLRRILGEGALSPAARGEIRFSLGLLLSQAGHESQAVAEIERSVRELHSRPGLAAWAMINLAVPSTFNGHLSQHIAWLERATRTAHRQDDPAVRTAVLADRAGILLLVGDPGGWRAVQEMPETGASLDEQRHLVRGRLNLAQATFHTGHFKHAVSFLEEGMAMSQRLGYERQIGGLEATGLLVDWATGNWDGLEERAALLFEETADVPPARVDAALVLGLLAEARGRAEEADDRLAACVISATRLRAVPILALAAAGRARVALAGGRPGEAVPHLLEPLEVIRRKGIWAWSGALAPTSVEVFLADGRPQEAEQLADQMARGLRDRDAPWAEAGLQMCRARLAEHAGRIEAALRRFAAATRIWARLPCLYETARSEEGWGRCALARGRESGRDRLVAALERFRALGAEADVARVRETLRSHGIVLPHRGGRRGYGNDLSPRENGVARLVAEGKTNRDIAQLLFVSPKTVEHHVSAVLRKLGTATRRDLIRFGVPTGREDASER